MFRKLAALLALTSAFALAGGGASPTPFGSTILPADTKTWRCESGRKVVSFSPNTQSVRIYYRGQQYALGDVPQKTNTTGILRHSDVGLGTDRLSGVGLEWVEHVKKRNVITLFRVNQQKNGQRYLTLLERCHQVQP